MGYHKAGFDSIVGVDREPQPHYPFDFTQADVFDLDIDFSEFDLIHASPPCQRYSWITPKDRRMSHPDSIPPTRRLLIETNRPYVIENVSGARKLLHNPLMLCGTMFGLKCWRHRYFEISYNTLILTPPCNHAIPSLPVTMAGSDTRAKRKNSDGFIKSVKHAKDAYGIDWMNYRELRESIPPAFTQFIGKYLLAFVQALTLKTP